MGSTSRAVAEPSSLSPEVGYNRGTIESARTAALGGGLRAFSGSIEALHSNPANMVLSRIYHLGGYAQLWPEAERRTYGVAVVDSLSNQSQVAGGLSATWLFQDPDGLDRKARDLRGALAFPLTNMVSLGVAGRYIDLSQNGVPRGTLPPSSASGGLRGSSILKELTIDVGLSIHSAEGFRLALVGQNLGDANHSLLPLTLGGGVGFGERMYTLEADVAYDFTTFEEPTLIANVGVEFLAAERFPLRMGYRFDDGLSSQFLSMGTGYVSREFSLDFAYRRSISGDRSTSIFLGLKYHVEAMRGSGQ